MGASAPTSTNSTVLHSFPHARIGSTSSITGRASTSPIRARPIINAIGAACRHASLHSGAPALSSVHCGQTMHRLSWRQHASPMGQAARSRPLAASTEQPGRACWLPTCGRSPVQPPASLIKGCRAAIQPLVRISCTAKIGRNAILTTNACKSGKSDVLYPPKVGQKLSIGLLR